MGSTSEGSSNLLGSIGRGGAMGYGGARGRGRSVGNSGSQRYALPVTNQGSGSSEPMGMVSRINRSTQHRLQQTEGEIQRLRRGSGGSAGMGMAMMFSKRGRELGRQKAGLLTPTPYNMGLWEDDPYGGGRRLSQYGLDTGFTGDFDKWKRSQARIKENEKYKKERIKREAATQAKIDSYWGAPAPPPDQSTINMSPYSNQ